MEDFVSLRLDLDAFEIDDLKASLAGSAVQVDREKPAEAYGEPITIAVIILAPLAIKGLAAWLTKRRERAELFDEVEIENPDGSRVRHRLHLKVSSSTTEPEVVRELVRGLNLDPKLVQAVAGLGK
jgi:hypothetical protein